MQVLTTAGDDEVERCAAVEQRRVERAAEPTEDIWRIEQADTGVDC